MQDSSHEDTRNVPAGDEVPELELTDADILDAMQHIPGYLDITTEDFRTIYHLAHRHAVGRLLAKCKAGKLMRVGVEPLLADMTLDVAAKALVRSGYKALPVVDQEGRVTGMLTEADFLRRLKVDSFLELLLSMLDDTFKFQHHYHEALVSEAMTAPAVTITRDAGFEEVIAAFHKHHGRSIPVVELDGRLAGMLQRKDFITAYNMEIMR